MSQVKQSAPLDQPSTSSFLESLLEDATESLPILRQSCIQVLNLTQDKRSSASDIGDIIKRDQAMMAKINSLPNQRQSRSSGLVTFKLRNDNLGGGELRGKFLVSRVRLERATLALKGQTRGIAIEND